MANIDRRQNEPAMLWSFRVVCVVFSLARIAFPKKSEVKHTIYFEWPNTVMLGYDWVVTVHNISQTTKLDIYKCLDFPQLS